MKDKEKKILSKPVKIEVEEGIKMSYSGFPIFGEETIFPLFVTYQDPETGEIVRVGFGLPRASLRELADLISSRLDGQISEEGGERH